MLSHTRKTWHNIRSDLWNTAKLKSMSIAWTKSLKTTTFCAVIFYFNYTCRVKKINKKYHETKTIINIYTFTVQLYNISTRSNTLKIIYTAGLASPFCTVFKSKLHHKIRFVCTYTELRLKYKGFNLDCNTKTQFILQCTRQLSSVCWVYVCVCQCACV